jgi:hypothetical protein
MVKARNPITLSREFGITQQNLSRPGGFLSAPCLSRFVLTVAALCNAQSPAMVGHSKDKFRFVQFAFMALLCVFFQLCVA